MSEGFGKATFLTCCVRVNSCSITSMTAVHFLHQTDTGLALRKHRAIYSITPTLFSPSPLLPPYLPRSVFAFVPCKQECGVKCVSCAGPTRPFSFAGFSHSPDFCPPFLGSSLHRFAGIFPLTPHRRLVLFFLFAEPFCCRFDHHD